MSFEQSQRIGNYHYDLNPGLVKRELDGDVYVIGFACAYNAFGLIGSECNGIFILNDTKRDVVLDEHMKIDSGYFGPRSEHLSEIAGLHRMTPDQFRDFIRNHPRARDGYSAKTRN